MAKQSARKPISSGVGESRVFAAAPGSFEPPAIDIRQCHLGGVLVADLEDKMPVGWITQITYRQTDEGTAEYNVGKEPVRAHVLSDPLDGKIRQYGDGLMAGMEPWEAPDPMRELAQAHVAPGMRPKFLSEKRIKEAGTRGFQVVTGANGDPVRLGNMILGEMPEAKAEQRNAHYRGIAREQAQRLDEQVQEQQAQLNRATGGGIRPIGPSQRSGIEADTFSLSDMGQEDRGYGPGEQPLD